MEAPMKRSHFIGIDVWYRKPGTRQRTAKRTPMIAVGGVQLPTHVFQSS
jgi:hypothetical protein